MGILHTVFDLITALCGYVLFFCFFVFFLFFFFFVFFFQNNVIIREKNCKIST